MTPESLPNVGLYNFAGATRTEETENRYLERAKGLKAAYLRDTDMPNTAFNPIDWAHYLLARRTSLGACSWRQYKASASFYLREQIKGMPAADPRRQDVEVALDLLQGASSRGITAPVPRTSALRLKEFYDADLELVLAALDESRSRWAKVTQDWLLLNCEFGLRPSEWVKADVQLRSSLAASDLESPPEVSLCEQWRASPLDPHQAINAFLRLAFSYAQQAASTESEVPSDQGLHLVLRVTNSKASNGRSNGATRVLPITYTLDGAENLRTLTRLCVFLLRVQQEVADNRYAVMYAGCRKALQRACEDVSCRIAFLVALAKSVYRGLSAEAIDEMLQEHLQNTSQKTCSLVSPLTLEVHRIRTDQSRHGTGGKLALAPQANADRNAPLEELYSPLKKIALYSGRHKFSSQMKKECSKAELAALMGHAVEDTASRHYAKPYGGSRHGSGGKLRPLGHEVASVRRATIVRTPPLHTHSPQPASPGTPSQGR